MALRGGIAVGLLLVAACSVALATDPPVAALPEPLAVRVYYDAVEDIRLLQDFDLWEFRDRVEHYVLINATREDLERVRSLGFRAEVDLARTAELHPPRDVEAIAGIPGFPCYRTVEETFATAQQIVAAHPTLATWSDIGDTWDKTMGLGGYDLWVLRLTNSAIPGPKPKLIATCAIHAREYTTAELCTRFAELLASGYDTNPDVTWILDHQEVHLILQTNPDGRKKAETGLGWRKNTNQNYCGATSNQRGADLNRNFEFEWDCCGGSSTNQCSDTFHGSGPASEPEVQAVEAYLRAQLPDQRGPNINDPVPLSATSVYLDIHSAGGLLLWPWGFGTLAPNWTQLRTLGRKLAFFNDHFPEQAVDLYVTDGTTIDFAYGDLGAAAYVYELGTTFFQSCSYFENTMLQPNLDSLFYAARTARSPYVTPAGPDTLNVTVFPAFVEPGDLVTVGAMTNDLRYNNDNGTEPTQPVAQAQFHLGRPWGLGGAPGQNLSATDGAFNETVEQVQGLADTAGLAGGKHLVYVRARDNANNWGAFAAAFLWIRGGPEGTLQGAVTEAGTGDPLEASLSVDSLGFSVESNAADGSFNMPLPPGTWTVRASSTYHHDQIVGSIVVTEGGTIQQNFTLALIDTDSDGVTDELDCAALSADLWSAPGSATGMRLSRAATNNVAWDAPLQTGGTSGPQYDVLRTTNSTDFNTALCFASNLTATSVTATADPPPGSLFIYLVRAENSCGGTLGVDSAGNPRSGVNCP